MSSFKALIGGALATLVLVVIFAIVPMIGSQVDEAADVPVNSSWNSSYNSDIQTGAELWGDTGGMISITAVILIVAILLGAFPQILLDDLPTSYQAPRRHGLMLHGVDRSRTFPTAIFCDLF